MDGTYNQNSYGIPIYNNVMFYPINLAKNFPNYMGVKIGTFKMEKMAAGWMMSADLMWADQ